MNRFLVAGPGRTGWILITASVVWCILFPEDLDAVLTPIRSVFQLTESLSPWFYSLCGVALICWSFGTRSRSRTSD